MVCGHDVTVEQHKLDRGHRHSLTWKRLLCRDQSGSRDFDQTLRIRAWPHNITVNAVAPGFVRTDMTKGGRGAGNWQGTEEAFAAKAMMGRIEEPEDIANAIAFLASPESA